jgi:hypothetical protein
VLYNDMEEEDNHPTTGWLWFVANLSLWTIPGDGGCRPRSFVRSFVSSGIFIVITGMGAMPLEVGG